MISTGTADRDFDLVVIGEVNPDIVVRAADPTPAFGQVERWVDSIEVVAGSSSVIMACGAVRLGLRTALVGLVGDDALGRFMLDELRGCGIDIAGVQARPGVRTGASVILSAPNDRAILTAPGAIPLLTAADVPRALLGRTRHVHVGHAFLLDALRPDLPALLDEARKHGATTSVDPNWDPTGRWGGGMADVIEHTDVFVPNGTEAARLTGAGDCESAARALLAAGPRVVAIKLGAEGALAIARGEEIQRIEAPRVDVVDTTGAGDSFDAGFIAGLLRGATLREALALGVACGSISTLGAGGTAAQPVLAEAEAMAAVLR